MDAEQIAINIGKNIRKARQVKGLTMASLGKKIDKTEATVQRYESGAIKSIPYDVIIDIANALGVSPTTIMGWDSIDDDWIIYSDENFKLYSKTRKIKKSYEPIFGEQLLNMTEKSEPSRDEMIKYLKDLPISAFGKSTNIYNMDDEELYEIYKTLKEDQEDN